MSPSRSVGPGAAVHAPPVIAPSLVDPASEYESRRRLRHQRAETREGRERLIGAARVVVFLAGVAIAYMSLREHWVSAWWLIAVGLLFLGLLFAHEVVRRALHRASWAVGFYRAGLARLSGE